MEERLREAWERVGPLVMGDLGELKARLGRRRTGALMAPPRAWCLAVRASDTRIHPYSAAIVPEYAFDGFEYAVHPSRQLERGERVPWAAVRWSGEKAKRRRGEGAGGRGGVGDIEHPRLNIQYRTGAEGGGDGEAASEGEGPGAHEVLLETRLLRRVCGPVWVPWPGVTCVELALVLGCHRYVVDEARRAGVFEEVKWRPLGGIGGPQRPIVWTKAALDAASCKRFGHADGVWGTLKDPVCWRVPEGIEQWVRRVPCFREKGRDKKDERGGETEAANGRGGEGATWKRRWAGWMWVCPGCGERARIVYCPLPVVWDVGLLTDAVFERFGLEASAVFDEEMDARPARVPTFACGRCHGVRYETGNGAWNHLVCHLSMGLLYGREVEREETR